MATCNEEILQQLFRASKTASIITTLVFQKLKGHHSSGDLLLFYILNSCCVCGLEDGKMGEHGKLLGTLYFPWLRLLFIVL
jgi:hypothetical protein